MDAPTVPIPKSGPSRVEITLTLSFLVVWLYETSKPGSSWLGFISGIAIVALGIPWFVRSLEFVRASVVPWAGMGLILAAIGILAVALSFSSDTSANALIGFSLIFLVFLLIAFPVFCAAAGLLAECCRLVRQIFTASSRGFHDELRTFFSWAIWPATMILMVVLSFVPLLLAVRVQMSEPALVGLIDDFGARNQQRMEVNGKVGFLTVAAVIKEKDHICLVTERFEDLDSAGLAYVPGSRPPVEHWAGRHIYGPWWKWRRTESWFRNIGRTDAAKEGKAAETKGSF